MYTNPISPLQGSGVANVFDHYQRLFDTFADAQQEAAAGFTESTAAMNHYFNACEAWLNALNQTATLGAKSEASARRGTQATARTPASMMPQSRHDQDQSASIDALRERVVELEHRQAAFEEKLDEIHAEVVQ